MTVSAGGRGVSLLIDNELVDIGDLTPTDSNVIVGNGTTWVAESGATLRTSLGLGTGNTVQFNSVGIGVAPSVKLHVQGASAGIGLGSELFRLETTATDTRFTVGIDDNNDFVWLRASKTSSETKMVINNSDSRVGMCGVTTPTASVHIKQSNATGAIPVLKLEQSDEDKPFADFVGTSAADATKSISTLTTSGSTTHHLRLAVNGVDLWVAGSTSAPS